MNPFLFNYDLEYLKPFSAVIGQSEPISKYVHQIEIGELKRDVEPNGLKRM